MAAGLPVPSAITYDYPAIELVQTSVRRTEQAAAGPQSMSIVATALHQIEAFLHELDAQNGKGVDAQAYTILKADALYVIGGLEP